MRTAALLSLLLLLMTGCSSNPAPISSEIVASDNGYVVVKRFRSPDGSFYETVGPLQSDAAHVDMGDPDASRIQDPALAPAGR